MKHISDILPAYYQAKLKAESPIELTMYHALRDLGINCELQYQLKGIRVDIAIPSVKLTIECDGKDFHQDKLRDMARDRAVRMQGWQVERYTGSDIYLNSRSLALSIARRYHLIKEIDEYDIVKNIKELSHDEFFEEEN